MWRFVHNNKIVLFGCLDGQRKRHYGSTRVYWTRWPLYTSLGPYCWTDFFCSEGRVSFMGKPVKDSPMWVTQWESDSTNQHGPLLLLAFSHAKKETQPWPTMSPLWLRFFSSYQFDSFFSLLNFSTRTTMPAVYGGVCVYTHTGHTSGEFAWPIPFFSSSSSVGILLNWPKRDSLTLDRERVVR